MKETFKMLNIISFFGANYVTVGLKSDTICYNFGTVF